VKKHLSQFYPQNGGESQLAVWHQNYVTVTPYGLYLMDDEYKITKHLGWMDWRKVVVLTVRKE